MDNLSSTDILTRIQERLSIIEGKINAVSGDTGGSTIVDKLNSIEASLRNNVPASVTTAFEQLQHQLTAVESAIGNDEGSPLAASIKQINERVAAVEGNLSQIPTQGDLTLISGRLEQIENKLGQKKPEWDKWLVPIIVALIGIATVIVQINQQRKSDAQIARYLEEDKQTGLQISLEKAAFFTKAKALLNEIDTRFEDVCNNPVDAKAIPREESLATSLAEFYKLRKSSIPDDLDRATIESLSKYAEYVVNAQFDII